MFPTFATRRILGAGQTAADFREVTATERAKLEAAAEAWQRPPQSFIDQWNAACVVNSKRYGKYNSETGLFELNSIKDLTYEEAVNIYVNKDGNGTQDEKFRNVVNCRTMFPLVINCGEWGNSGAIRNTFRKCSFEDIVIDSSNGYAVCFNCAFHYASKVKRITGFKIGENAVIGANTFQGTPWSFYLELTIASVYTKNVSFDFKYNGLTLESWQFLVAKSPKHTGTITIIVPQFVYNKLNEENNTEWNKVLTDAAEKNITFATA